MNNASEILQRDTDLRRLVPGNVADLSSILMMGNSYYSMMLRDEYGLFS